MPAIASATLSLDISRRVIIGDFTESPTRFFEYGANGVDKVEFCDTTPDDLSQPAKPSGHLLINGEPYKKGVLLRGLVIQVDTTLYTLIAIGEPSAGQLEDARQY